jgi:hypothetical protein
LPDRFSTTLAIPPALKIFIPYSFLVLDNYKNNLKNFNLVKDENRESILWNPMCQVEQFGIYITKNEKLAWEYLRSVLFFFFLSCYV